jgi:glycine/D-amino acid oxidase-like deaminating enzyme
VAADRRRLTADILVAGAGPAGLALALQAHDHGAVVRVVDRRPEAIRPGPTPRQRPTCGSSALRARLAPLAAPLVPMLTRGRPAASGIRLLSQLDAATAGSSRLPRHHGVFLDEEP